MLSYDLGEMRSLDGSALRYEVEKRVSEHVLAISKEIVKMSYYKKLEKQIPSPRLLLYFQFVMRQEIYSYVRQASVIEWYKNNGKMVSQKEARVEIPRSDLTLLLEKCWKFNHIPMVVVSRFYYVITHDLVASVKQIIKVYAKRMFRVARAFSHDLKNRHYDVPESRRPRIACHYAQGVDRLRKNDIHWFLDSGVSPEDVLIYFDMEHSTQTAKRGKLVSREVVNDLEKSGFSWVALCNGIMEDQGSSYWKPSRNQEADIFFKYDTLDNNERWLANVSRELLTKVGYWRSFHQTFNIKVHYVSEEGTERNIAQAIAFDIDKSGFLVSHQRSELFLSFAGDHPKHIFFVWDKRIHSMSKHDKIEHFIVTGNSYAKQKAVSDKELLEFCKKVRHQGVEFIVAMFDNVHGKDIHYSTKQMADFYQTMLLWVIEDPSISLIIKPKKMSTIKNLALINDCLKKAQDTGRCLIVSNPLSRMPLEVASLADISVGCGISSAISEIALAGCRGINYDMTHIRKHEFYSLGYKRIIFDDIKDMMYALKRFKIGPKDACDLGNWSSIFDKNDVFMDGLGGYRVGRYMSWLLDCFRDGKRSDEAVEYANDCYAAKWGRNNILRGEHLNELA